MTEVDFYAIDVETANPDFSSICQIGIAGFKDGQIVDEWCSLIDPEDYFDWINIEIHGIEEEHVKGQPKFHEVTKVLSEKLTDKLCIHHTHFDRSSINRACEKYNLELIKANWLDSARVTRRTWEEFAWQGYGLSNVCDHIGYAFKHHDALEDAKAAGNVFVAAVEKSGIVYENWLTRVEQRIDLETGKNYSSKYREEICRDGNPDGILFGEVIVFTGTLQIVRREASKRASELGCAVNNNVTKDTTIVVVGKQDIRALAGHEKSTKHRKAEEKIRKGQKIRIISEDDFMRLGQSI